MRSKPVLVLRSDTERPEAVKAGAARILGTRAETIVAAASELLTDQAAYCRMTKAGSPYGDGQAARRIATICRRFLSSGERLPQAPRGFVPVYAIGLA